MKERTVEKLRLWRRDSIAFARDNFSFSPDPFQAEMMQAWDRGDQRIAAKSSKGPGKTCILAILTWQFLATRPHPRVGCTSISGDNLDDCLWPEMAKWQNRSPFLKSQFNWAKTRIVARDHPETWFASARTWSKNADSRQQADTLAGLHEDYTLFVIDEAGGVPDAVAVTAEAALASGIETRMLMAGNPTHLSGPLYRAATTEKNLWTLITATGDPDNPKRSPRVSMEWARSMIERFGRDNPWVMINVLGEFPNASLMALLGPEDVEAAFSRKDVGPYDQVKVAKVLGVDVARSAAGHRTVIFPRQGLDARSRPYKVFRGLRTQETVDQVSREADEWGADAIVVDDTGGWGAGTIDGLNMRGYPVIGVNSSGKPNNPRYYNKRAEMLFEAAEWVRSAGRLPRSDEVKREAPLATYFFNRNKMQVVDKDVIMEELGESPDVWDAFCLTFGAAVAPRDEASRLRQALGLEAGSSMIKDYNPYDDARLRAEEI